MTKWYGSLENRLEENKMFVDKIEVGTGVTEYSWSDRHPYEVIEVIDQKHVVIRALDHKHVGDGSMDNNWEYISNENNACFYLTKRGQYWYNTNTVTCEQYEAANPEKRLWMALNGFDPSVILSKGKQTKYQRMNVSFGHAEYYYDYSF